MANVSASISSSMTSPSACAIRNDCVSAEAALRQAQKMESIGQLTGGVAHDFNNLLAVFATGVQLMERNITAAQRQRTLEGMRRAVERGTGLTRHLLAFSRRRPINPESIDLRTHLSGMRQMFDGALGGNIKVEMVFGDGLWPVEVDAGELELAILNLCVNARDAMAVGGTITISRRERAPRRSAATRRTNSSSCRSPTPACGMPPEVAGARLRAVLHDQGCQQGLRPGPAAGLRVRPAIRRPRLDREQGRRRHRRDRAAAARDRCNLRQRPMVEDRPRQSTAEAAHAEGTCCWSRTTAKCRRSPRRCCASLGFTVIHVTSADAALGRAGQRPRDRLRAVRHHDARRRERAGAGARDTPPLSGTCRSR